MIKWYEPRKNRRKIIEVVEGYTSFGDEGHIHLKVVDILPAWVMPLIYKDNPNPKNFRKVRITYEEIK